MAPRDTSISVGVRGRDDGITALLDRIRRGLKDLIGMQRTSRTATDAEVRAARERLEATRAAVQGEQASLRQVRAAVRERVAAEEQVVAAARVAAAQARQRAQAELATVRQNMNDRVQFAREIGAQARQRATESARTLQNLRTEQSEYRRTSNAAMEGIKRRRDSEREQLGLARERLAFARLERQTLREQGDAADPAALAANRQRIRDLREEIELRKSYVRERQSEVNAARTEQRTRLSDMQAGIAAARQNYQTQQQAAQQARANAVAAQQAAVQNVAAARAQMQAQVQLGRVTVQQATRNIAAVRAQGAAQIRQAQQALIVAQGQRALAAAALVAARGMATLASAAGRTNAALKTHGDFLSSATRRLLAWGAALGAANLFRTFIREGLEFNRVVETATLGIAALITATSALSTAQRGQLEGEEKLAAAYTLAKDQINKLRIEGLRTAATTEQLTEAFQQAVASGIGAGLTLDEIRGVSVRVAQAMAAIGQPLSQMNQEVRSILDATIDRNSRVARTLGITNEQVRAMKEQGRLAEFLNQRFQSFATAAERAATTFTVLRANMKEALQVLAGDATAPLFEQLRQGMQEALEGAFDFDTARVAARFQPLVEGLQVFFNEIGMVLRDAMEAAVEGAADFGIWLQRNRTQVVAVTRAVMEVIRAIGGAIVAVSKLVGMVIMLGAKSGLLVGIFRTVEQAINLLATPLGAVIAGVTALVGIGLKLVAVFTAFKAIMATLGLVSLANPIGIVIAGVGALALAVNTLIAARKNQLAQERAILSAQAAQMAGSIRLSQQYVQLAKDLDGNTLSAERRAEALTKLHAIGRQLFAQDSRYGRILSQQTGNFTETIRMIQALANERVKEAEATAVQVRHGIALLQQQKAAAIASAPTLNDANRIRKQFDEGIAATNRLLFVAEERAKAARQAMLELSDVTVPILDPITMTPTVGDPDADKGSKALNDFKQGIEAAIEVVQARMRREMAELERQQKEGLLSIEQFVNGMNASVNRGINEQIALRQRLANALTDPGEKAQQLGEIRELNEQRTQAEEEHAEKRLELQRALARDIQTVQIAILENEGRHAEAAALEIERKYADLIRRLKAEGASANIVLTAVLQLKAQEVSAAIREEAENAAEQVQTDLDRELGRISMMVEAGAMDEVTARRAVYDAYNQSRTALVALQQSYQILLDTTKDPGAKQAVDDLGEAIGKMSGKVQAAKIAMEGVKRAIGSGLMQSLEEFFTTGIQQAESFEQAFKGLLVSVLQMLNEIIMRLIAFKIATAILNPLGIAVPAPFERGGPVRGYARGGGVDLHYPRKRGHIAEGSPGRDRVRAQVTVGEYVLTGAAVRKVGGGSHQMGVRLLNEINFGTANVPLPKGRSHFAAGGPVTMPEEVGRQAVDVNSTLRVIADRSVILEVLASDEGQQVQIENTEKNPRTIGRILRR